MVSLADLWMPIVVSAVFVFVVSSIVHMVLKYHRSDYHKIPNDDAVAHALGGNLAPGTYTYPCVEMKDMKEPANLEKYKRGPVFLMNVLPSGAPQMGKYLMLWFLYSVLVSLFAAYVTGRTVDAGTDYLAVFRVAGTVAFMSYGLGPIVDSIWRGQLWSVTTKHVFDGLLYSLVTAGTFGWLWPQ
jgi:hypothetical protein